ncbi:hypothetical protein AAKU52_000448 [Pedobacter sp. CG_S7]|uniref:carboxypeptidase regulatory-like domain-containing protein n=1 Tax=Pedobacter sp. CG_S7 TaxID=3143930 RepID=UPI0033925004
MKSYKIAVLIILSVALFAFKAQNSGALQGRIIPVEGVKEILVISGADTIKVQNINGGFLLKNLPAKTYKVMIKAASPYLDYTLNEVAVIDSATTDIGQIQLLK